MITVGFLLTIPKEYKGGINYLDNLYIAINKVKDSGIKLILFVPSDLPAEYIALFGPHCTIVKTKLLQRKTFPWLIDKVYQKVIGTKILTELLLKKYKIDVLSHSYYVPSNKKIKTINWVPDFQYLHYPNLWTVKQLADTTNLIDGLIKTSDKILLSSNDAFNDFKTIHPDMAQKVEVVHFVSQPQQPLGQLDLGTMKSDVQKYVAEGIPYFYLPNQFWSHKNHLCAFKACKILFDKGYKFQLLTSGYMKDFRSGDEHINNLIGYVNEQGLEHTVKFLGLIPYKDVFSLIINATALINPSYFEGWSSTVEEAKTVGTLTLLSNIPVHREQDPLNAQFFNPDDPTQLAQIMEDVLTGKILYQRPSIEFLQKQLDTRTLTFGEKYINLVKRLA